MDATRFDRLTRALSAAAARRSLLAGVVSGLLAALPFALRADETAAKKKHKKWRKKKRNAVVPPAPLPPPLPPPSCASGQRLCGAQCVTGTCCPGEACGPACQCGLTLEGDAFCFATGVRFSCDPCASSAACPAGFRCRQTTECDGVSTRCFVACQDQPLETTSV